MKIISKCKSYPKNFEARLFIDFNQSGYLEISTNNELRKFVLLCVTFEAVSEEAMKGSIVFRYSVLKAKTELFENRLLEILQVTKKTNPNLALLFMEGNNKF